MGGTYALIVAAGRGERLGGGQPKQYRPLGGRPLLAWAMEAFERHPAITAIRCVIAPDARELYDSACPVLRKLLAPVEGGASRQESVRLGLESLLEFSPDRVLIHDAARPFVTAGMIDSVLQGLDEHAGALPAIPVVDSLRRDEAGFCGEAVDRDGLVRAQTPQGFRFPDILAAHRAAQEQYSDDAFLARAGGLAVTLVPGDEKAFKVTTAEDLERAEAMLLPKRETRIGQGYDVHRLIDGESITLCGVVIAHDKMLEGHSDADVGLHALVDALLGALGMGDIGQHFPPGDPKWKGADSAVFVEGARDLLKASRATVSNIDLTLVCERPKIAPHVPAMRARIAELLGIDQSRVSVKATTSERLGFTGREEGIAAQAVAAITVPQEEKP